MTTSIPPELIGPAELSMMVIVFIMMLVFLLLIPLVLWRLTK